jgi:ABC-type uncharacterized transport system ATPase subunit
MEKSVMSLLNNFANEIESLVVIENDMRIFKSLEKKIPCVFGNSFNEEVLIEAQIKCW